MVKRYTSYELAMKFPHGETRCYDCGQLYGGPEWIEAHVPTSIWCQIQPTDPAEEKGAGILCINCINKRCLELGLSNVPVMFGGEEALKVACDPAFCDFKPIADMHAIREQIRYQVKTLGMIVEHYSADHAEMLGMLRELSATGDAFLDEHNLQFVE